MAEPKEQVVVVAGASGYLGRRLVTVLKNRRYRVRALLRKEPAPDLFIRQPDELFIAEATEPHTLTHLCQEADMVISTLGITRQKDGLSYDEVDYGANRNILQEALRSKVKRFVYVSVLNGRSLRNTRLVAAKERFVDLLESSALPATIIRPSGFFSDMADFYQMAANGTVYLFGSGSIKINPIDGTDLAEEIVSSMERGDAELNIGGPKTYTLQGIAELALAVHEQKSGRKGKIRHLPDIIRKLTLLFLPYISPLSVYGPVQFFLSAIAQDGNAEEYGQKTLEAFFTTLD